jgi:hypothetical protein
MQLDVSTLLNQFFRATTSEFSLEQLELFPFSEYSRNQARYNEEESWFSGTALDEVIQTGKTQVDKYPIKVNPIYGAVLKHAYALFGEFPDDAEGPLVHPKVKNVDGTTTAETKHVEDVLYQMWTENNGGSLQMESGVISQVYGGCALRLAHDPLDDDLETKIRIEMVRPREFIGIPREDNPWALKEAWLVREITRKTAAEYGVAISRGKGWYLERWTPQEYFVVINNVPLGFTIGDEVYKVGGRNPFGFVPFVYIPHIRYGGFYGDSLIRDSVKGLCRELNARLADAGDAVSDDTHSYGVMANTRGMPQVVEIAPGFRVVNLGMTQNIVGGEAEPKLEFPSKPKVSEPALKLNDILYDQFRREVYVPAVADGEDEGSQRSSLTLTTRMWPLISHVKQERTFWSTGLRAVNRMALKMMAVKGLQGITPEHARMRLSSKWFPVLPRDREMLINELSVRAAANIGSLEHLLELAGDVENVPQEMERIQQWLEFVAGLKPVTPVTGNAQTAKKMPTGGA